MEPDARLDAWGYLVVHQIISYIYQVLVSLQKVQKCRIWLFFPQLVQQQIEHLHSQCWWQLAVSADGLFPRCVF